MKKFKTNYWAALLVMACFAVIPTTVLRADNSTNSSGATPGAGAKGDRGGAIKAELEKLNLTPDQKQKVRTVMRDQQEKFKALKDDTSLTKEERVEQFKTIMQSTNTKFKTIFTPAQYSQWEEFTKGMKDRVAKNLPDTDQTPLLPVK